MKRKEIIMNQTQRLLQAVVENGRMGEDACDQLLRRARDNAIRQELMLEKQHYAEAVRDAEQRLYSMGVQPRPKGPAARMGIWMGMQINTAVDRSASHIADMLIQGSTMGVIELTKARNSCADANADAQGVASNLITKQQEAIERLKAFLQQKAVVQ